MNDHTTAFRTFDPVIADLFEQQLRSEKIEYRRIGGNAALLGAGPSAVEQRFDVASSELGRVRELVEQLSAPDAADPALSTDGQCTTRGAREGVFRRLVPALVRAWFFAFGGFMLGGLVAVSFSYARSLGVPSLQLIHVDRLVLWPAAAGLLASLAPRGHKALSFGVALLIILLLAAVGGYE